MPGWEVGAGRGGQKAADGSAASQYTSPQVSRLLWVEVTSEAQATFPEAQAHNCPAGKAESLFQYFQPSQNPASVARLETHAHL